MSINLLSMIKKLLIVSLFLICTPIIGGEHKELKAFPLAKEGMERFVIVLPHKERGDEDNFKVELIPGKTLLTDGENLMRLGISIETHPLKGWGYNYYEVTGRDIAISTRMAPSKDKQAIQQFVSGTPLFIRYNSRLPIVIYLNKGIEIQYRIWKASETTQTAEKG